MSATSTQPASFSLVHDPTTSLLVGHWAGPVDETHLRAHYADLLAAASAHGNCRFWLLDMRVRNWHTPEFGRWFDQVFAETAHATLHQSLFIAYLLSSEHHTLVNTRGVQATQRGCLTHDVYPFFFDSEEAAREWLAHQQTHA